MTAQDSILFESLKEKFLNNDRKSCFIERETTLRKISKIYPLNRPGYATIIAQVLDESTCPIDDDDVIAGRMVEARAEEGWVVPMRDVLANPGHIHFDWEKVLNCGTDEICAQIERRAQELGDGRSHIFARNSRIQLDAVKRYALRYAQAAEDKAANATTDEAKKRFTRMAEALKVVPMKPAYDLFSALQCIWLLHMIASCHVGARDYGFGRPDQYLNKFYLQDIENGTLTKDEADMLLAFFYIKPNEIIGTGSYNFEIKPVPCQSSKQYITLGGCDENGKSMATEVSYALLRAEEISNLPQPVIVCRIRPGVDPAFEEATYKTMSIATDKMHIYNDEIVFNSLVDQNVPPEIACDTTFSGCCHVELNHRTIRNELFMPVPTWLDDVLGVTTDRDSSDYASVEDLIEALKQEAKKHIEELVVGTVCNDNSWRIADQRGHTFDGIFMGECADRCRYPLEGGTPIQLINVYFAGAATIIDSLSAIDRLVFQEKRFTLPEYVAILRNNFEGHEILQAEVKNKFPKFGNDDPVADKYAGTAMNALLDALDETDRPSDYVLCGGFYSLHHHNNYGWELAATPDGRLKGEAFSENQSPVYGADKKGVTALLKSVAKLPMHRTPCGGINLTFTETMTPERLKAITEAYFKMGGLHMAFTVTDRETLLDAMAHPENHRNLTVRLFGFSEYFINLSDWQKQEILDRTKL